MKSKIIKGAVDILLVDYSGYKLPFSNRPEDLSKAYDFKFNDGKIEFKLPANEDGIGIRTCSQWIIFSKVPGIWQFHCRLSEMTEDQAEKLVEKTDNPFWIGHDIIYIDYLNDNNCFETAEESFQSLLDENGVMHENPVKDTMYNTDHYSDDCYCTSCENETARCDAAQKKWQEAEANVFNPLTTLIFIKHENNKD